MNELNIRANLLAHIYQQLPTGIRDAFKIRVESDAYLIRPKAIFTDPRGQDWRCDLEALVGGDSSLSLIRTQVPKAMLAHLCTIV